MNRTQLKVKAICIITEILDIKMKGKEVVYISGKVTGLHPEETKQKFASAEHNLNNAGYYCFNPTANIEPDCDWNLAMRLCLSVLPMCDYVYLLTDWKESKGAKVEKLMADKLQMVLWHQTNLPF